MTMTAVLAPVPGGPESLVTREIATPVPGQGEVLIEVAAAGVNRADVMQREGLYDPPPGASDVLGLECSGIVVAVGPEVDPEWVGLEVCALLPGGGYAEFVTAPVELVLPVPDGVSLIDAAGLVETAATVWSNMIDRGGLAAGDVVLVHGGASGIGSTAIQLARAWGAEVVATAGSPAKVDHCRRIGATLVIDHSAEDFEAVLAAGGRAVDVVVDVVGGPYLERNLSVLRRGGRLVLIGLLGGPRAEVDLSTFLLKDLTLTGSGLRTQPLAVKARIVRGVREQVWPLYVSGVLRPTTDTVVPLRQADIAHTVLESGAAQGKVVLAVSSSVIVTTEVS